jgi:hypothetical protein
MRGRGTDCSRQPALPADGQPRVTGDPRPRLAGQAPCRHAACGTAGPAIPSLAVNGSLEFPNSGIKRRVRPSPSSPAARPTRTCAGSVSRPLPAASPASRRPRWRSRTPWTARAPTSSPTTGSSPSRSAPWTARPSSGATGTRPRSPPRWWSRRTSTSTAPWTGAATRSTRC